MLSNTFLNLLTGAIGVANASLPVGGTTVKAYLGPGAGFDNSSGNQRVSFSAGMPAAVAPYPATLAGIFSVTALHASSVQNIIENAAGAQLQLCMNGAGSTFVLNRWGGSNDDTGFTPTVKVPYFLAVTTDNTSTTVFVWTRLDTGVVRFFTATPAGAAVPGTIATSIGNSSAGNAFDGFIGPVMYSQAVNTLGAMLEWAADPWSFWYPDPVNVGFDAELVGGAGGSPPPPSGAVLRTLLGVGR